MGGYKLEFQVKFGFYLCGLDVIFFVLFISFPFNISFYIHPLYTKVIIYQKIWPPWDFGDRRRRQVISPTISKLILKMNNQIWSMYFSLSLFSFLTFYWLLMFLWSFTRLMYLIRSPTIFMIITFWSRFPTVVIQKHQRNIFTWNVSLSYI